MLNRSSRLERKSISEAAPRPSLSAARPASTKSDMWAWVKDIGKLSSCWKAASLPWIRRRIRLGRVACLPRDARHSVESAQAAVACYSLPDPCSSCSLTRPGKAKKRLDLGKYYSLCNTRTYICIYTYTYIYMCVCRVLYYRLDTIYSIRQRPQTHRPEMRVSTFESVIPLLRKHLRRLQATLSCQT